MAKYDFQGVVNEIRDVRVYGKKGIQEREFWVQEPAAPNSRGFANILPFVIKYDPTGDKFNNLSQLDTIDVGDTVKFSFTMRGHKWEDPKTGKTRLFSDNKVVSKIEVVARATRSEQGGAQPRSVPPPVQAQDVGANDPADFPF